MRNSEPAAPIRWRDEHGIDNIHPGMSMRDAFAIAALQGIIAGGFIGTLPHNHEDHGRTAAKFAYMYADAMLSERER